MSTSTELAIIPDIEGAKKLALITPSSALAVKQAYIPHFTAFLELEKKADSIAVNAPKAAQRMRLDLRKVRTAADKDRKALGEEGRRYVEAVNEIYNILEARLSPIEEKMRGIEEAEERAEKERQTKLKEARIAEMSPFGLDLTFYDLGGMPEPQFRQLFESTKAAHEAKVAAEKKAEQDRIAAEQAKEAERVRLAEENARLAKVAAEAEKARKEAEEKARVEREKAAAEALRIQKENEAKLAKERAEVEAKQRAAKEKADAEKKAADEAARKEREALELKVKKEREAAEKVAQAERARQEAIQKELKAKAEAAQREANRLAEEAKAREKAEADRIAKEKEAQKKAAKAPDKQKLMTFAKTIRDLPVPVLSMESNDLFKKIGEQGIKFASWIESEANKL